MRGGGHTLAILAREAGLREPVSLGNPEVLEDVREALKVEFNPRYSTVLDGSRGVVVVSEAFGRGFDVAVEYFAELLGSRSEELGLRPNLITNREEVRKIVAFFTWGAMTALAGYTNGFPYMPGIVEPKLDVTKATWITFFILLASTMVIAGLIIAKLVEQWHAMFTVSPLYSFNVASSSKLAALSITLCSSINDSSAFIGFNR
jgi:nitric oxide reductase large subunit